MMRTARMTVILGLHTGVIMAASGHHHFGSAMLMGHLTGILTMHGLTFPTDLRGLAFHGDGRERLNRKAQREQHDEEKFAPVRHGYGV
jgi:hypothetical protein